MERHPYRQAFVDRDLDRVVALLADDVVFHSPVIGGSAFEGRDSVAALYTMTFDSFSDIEFTHEFGNENAHALVSRAMVLSRPIEATTLLEFNADGEIREIWVMVRPLSGVVAVAEEIGSRLAKRRGRGFALAIRMLLKITAGQAAVTDRIGSRLIDALNRSAA
jgi:SnoaL-like domain